MKRILFLALVLFGSLKSSLAQTSTCGTVPFTVTVTQIQQIQCNGQCTAALMATVSGGVGPFSFQWNPSGFTGQTITGLCAGTYVLMVVDVGQGQTCMVTVNITQPSVLNAITTQMAPSCATACDGVIAGTQSGGTPGYSVAWTNLTTGAPMGSNPTQTGICNGQYQYCVTDANGCTDCDIITVNQTAPCSTPCSLNVVTTTQPAICTSSTGSACVSVSGGSGNYSYLWGASAGAQNTSCATGIPSGNHCVTITDITSGCDTVLCMNIGTSTSNVVATGVVSKPACASSCNATFNAFASGGTGPYTFSVDGSPFQSSGFFSGLCAGTHILTAKDANGCQGVFTFIVNTNNLSLTQTVTQPSCATCCDGIIQGLVSGGIAPYSFQLTPFAPGLGTYTNLCNGTYILCVTDASACQVCNPIVLNSSASACSLSVVTTTQPAICSSATGSACVSVSGGSGNYTYDFGMGPQASSCATNLTPGTQCVTIADLVSGCDTVICYTITSTSSNVVATGIPTDATCNGLCDGTFTAIASGGTQPYTYSVDNGPFQSSTLFTGLCPGVHILTAKDVNGCTAIFTFIIGNPTAINITYNATPPSCATACDGSIVFNVTGGTAPYMYTMNGGAPGPGSSFNNLCNGTYVFCATDGNGCTNCVTVVLNTTTPCNTCGFTIVSTTQPAMCTSSSGMACISVTGGSGSYSYLWGTSAGGQTTACANNLPAGTHCVTITDMVNLCDSTICVTVSQSTSNMVATAIPVNVTCNGLCDGQITALASGGTQPYTYALNNGAYQTNNVFTGVCAGIHIVYAKDAYGCTAIYTVMVTEPSAISVVTNVSSPPSSSTACDGTVSGTGTGGTGAFTYSWSILGGGVVSTQPNLTGACDTTYVLCLTDANGCTDCDTIDVNAGNSIAEWNAGMFSVYPNPANAEFFIQTSQPLKAGVTVFDALGRLKYTTLLNGNLIRVPMNSDWSSGLYIIKISDNAHNYSVRVVKR